MKNQFKRYIPALIKEELDKIEYPRKDNLYTILDLIHRKEVYYKNDKQKIYGFTEIPKAQFKELLPSSDNLLDDIEFLIDNGFILRNDFYTIGKKSKSYKICSEYLGKLTAVVITNKNINKRILNQILKAREAKAKRLEFAQTEYFQSFKIDVEGAMSAIQKHTIKELTQLGMDVGIVITNADAVSILENSRESLPQRLIFVNSNKVQQYHNILHRFMLYNIRINTINDGFLFFKRNETNGRLDSNLTSLPSFLRPFIISRERLMYLDIKNSQPFFLYTLLKNKPEIAFEELNRYAELVINGTLYEYLMKEYFQFKGRELGRKQVKLMLCRIFYSRDTSFTEYKEFFGKLFPTIMQFIRDTNLKEHKTLAIQLQTMESFTVLDKVMVALQARGINPYTIHDGFVCKESEAEAIKYVFYEEVNELYGIAPSLHCDYIDKEEEDNEKSEPVLHDADELVDTGDKEQIEQDMMEEDLGW